MLSSVDSSTGYLILTGLLGAYSREEEALYWRPAWTVAGLEVRCYQVSWARRMRELRFDYSASGMEASSSPSKVLLSSRPAAMSQISTEAIE